MSLEIKRYTPDAELLIEEAMRLCHGGTVDPNGKPNKKFIQGIIKLGHESPLEHASVTFMLRGASRAMTHQLVRHRIASYSQKSQRYVKEDQFQYVTPDSIMNKEEICKEYDKTMAKLQEFYNYMIKCGILREDARYILPNACESDIMFTMNFRELRNFIKLRSEKHAQWEIRQYSDMMLTELYEKFPIIFEDLFIQFIPEGVDEFRYNDRGEKEFIKHIGPVKDS